MAGTLSASTADKVAFRNEVQANARLIAAAPDMARELGDGIKLVEWFLDDSDSNNIEGALIALRWWLDEAKKTYAKAEGR